MSNNIMDMSLGFSISVLETMRENMRKERQREIEDHVKELRRRRVSKREIENFIVSFAKTCEEYDNAVFKKLETQNLVSHAARCVGCSFIPCFTILHFTVAIETLHQILPDMFSEFDGKYTELIELLASLGLDIDTVLPDLPRVMVDISEAITSFLSGFDTDGYALIKAFEKYDPLVDDGSLFNIDWAIVDSLLVNETYGTDA